MINERYKRESITRDRPVAHFVKGCIWLVLGYGGLLALLVYSGASALQTLRKLHEAEETARANSLERRRVLATVVLSANIYADHIEEVLLSYKTPDAPDVAAETSKRAEAARAALNAYPADRTTEE